MLVMIRLRNEDQNAALDCSVVFDIVIIEHITDNERTRKKKLVRLFNYLLIPKRNFLIGSWYENSSNLLLMSLIIERYPAPNSIFKISTR